MCFLCVFFCCCLFFVFLIKGVIGYHVGIGANTKGSFGIGVSERTNRGSLGIGAFKKGVYRQAHNAYPYIREPLAPGILSL